MKSPERLIRKFCDLPSNMVHLLDSALDHIRAEGAAAESARRNEERCVWREVSLHNRVERQFDGCNGRWGYVDSYAFRFCPDCGKRIEIQSEGKSDVR